MSDHPNDSVAIRLPTQMGSNGDGGEQLVILNQSKNAWLAATMASLRKIWSPLAYDVGDTFKRMRNWNHDEDPNQRQVKRSLNNDEDPNQRQVMRSLNNDDDHNQRQVMRSLNNDDEPIQRQVMRSLIELVSHLIELVSHLILCMIMTILLPISLPCKQIKRGRFTLGCKWLLAVSCIAMTFDPLFLYISFIDEKNKCLGMNKTLRAAALALRSLTDLVFAFHIVALIHDRIDYVPPNPDRSPKDHVLECIISRRRLSKGIIIHFLGILPIPQVTIIIVFFRIRGSPAIGNFFLLLQFIVRGCQIYHFQRQFTMRGKWTTSAFYFLMYILAANVLGASWYFLSIQREISCWHQTYRNITGCIAINYCEDTSSSACANITLLNKFCPINPSNATLYNFGIFLGALESGNVGPKSFWPKYFYTLWWGIRNLSNFGTNLETSNYGWEICFTIIISLVGLVLFIYLMGNVQTYILWESTRALKDEEETVKNKYQALTEWLTSHGINEKTETQVVEIIKQNKVLERKHGHVAVDLVFVFNAIKKENTKKWEFWTRLCENALKNVTILQHRSIYDLGELLDALHPVRYAKDDYVVRQGDPDDTMLIITEGIITCTYKTAPSVIPKLSFEKGEVYGQELLSMNLNVTPPESFRDVQCKTKVEAFALTAHKLKKIAVFLEEVKKTYDELKAAKSKKRERIEKDIIEWLSRNGVPDYLQTSVKKHIEANHHELEKDLDAEVDLKYLFSNIGLSGDIKYHIKEHLCMNTLRKVPVLKSVDQDVLHSICMSLEPVILQKDDDVFKPGDQIDRMLIIVAGEIISIEPTIYRGYGPAEKPNVESKKKGDFVGDKVLMSAFPDTSISNSRPVFSNEYVECYTKVEAFALTKEGVTTSTKGASTIIIKKRLEHLIQLQSKMFQQQGQKLDEMAAYLARLGYPGTSPPPPPPPAA